MWRYEVSGSCKSWVVGGRFRRFRIWVAKPRIDLDPVPNADSDSALPLQLMVQVSALVVQHMDGHCVQILLLSTTNR